jgi:hypothetical protein
MIKKPLDEKPNVLSELLIQLGKAVSKLSDEEIAAILDGKKRITVVLEEKKLPDPKKVNHTREGLLELLAKLRIVDTREAAISLIEQSNPTRQDLAFIARELDTPVQKIDDIARLKEKIVEATIGFKLRSKAIQG